MSMTATRDELEAAAAAYALVACVDRRLDKKECQRFGVLIPADGKGRAIRTAFVSYCDALRADFSKGRRQAFSSLEKVSGVQMASDRVLRIAQRAVVADGRIVSEEETILTEIQAALGHSGNEPA